MPKDSRDSFTQATWNVVHRDGLDALQPTLLIPDRDHIVVLDGVPSTEDQSSIARQWAVEIARPNESYILAFRSGRNCFTVAAFKDGACAEVTHVVPGA
jgi:hypothetical protein